MKEFTVSKIVFKKSKVLQLVQTLKDRLCSANIFFELGNTNKEMSGNDFWDKNDFRKYFFEEENILTGSEMIMSAANLDDNWRESKAISNEPISFEQASALIAFWQKKMSYRYFTFLIGFDFNKDNMSRKYGYEKAKSYHDEGNNYLSDSVIFSKRLSGDLCVHISRSELNRNPISCDEILAAFSDAKLVEEKKYYMPSDEQEALEWEERYAKAKESFDVMRRGLKEVYQNLPYDLEPRLFELCLNQEDIKVRTLAKKELEPLDWELLKNKPGQKGTNFIKPHLDGNIVVNIDALHGGHYLQIQIFYVGKKYYFFDNIDFTYNVFTDEDAKKFFGNLSYVLDYVEKTLE